MPPKDSGKSNRFARQMPGRLSSAPALVLALLVAGAPLRWASAHEMPLASIDAAVAREVEAGHIPGAVVLIAHDGQVVYRRAYGYRELLPVRQPMLADTIFDLASLTKVVATTTAVMQLVEQGALRLDDPVARYWPAFGTRGKERITVRQLLTHFSGLAPDLDLSARWSGYDTALARIVAGRPLAPPGVRFRYSDVNFEVLGELVHRVSGQPLDAYCAEHIFAPLGMHDTGFTPSPARRERIAPTTYVRGHALSGRVYDPTAFRMGGVAGHAGLFSTADDLAIFAQMLLDGGRANGVQILRPDTVDMITTPQSPPGAPVRRGLGWDIDSPFASAWHTRLSDRAFGHTGYTGTSLWIDPVSRTFVIILSNRVHPNDKGDVRPLRNAIAALVSQALAPQALVAHTLQPTGDDGRTETGADASGRAIVQTGLDVLEGEGFAPLAGLRVGLITNHSGRDSSGRRTIDLVRNADGVKLLAVFTPEHGLDGDVDGNVMSGHEPTTGLPLYSLYGAVERPTSAMLEGLDALVFDVQDAGVRFYTYITTMAYGMEAAASKGIPFYVLDRPNPIGASIVQGPILDANLKSFTGYFPLPVRYGMTIGEVAQLFNEESHIGVDLRVITMRGYRRDQWYDETGLRWINPSPNLRSLREVTLYSGVALVEGANVSVGRGTASPFELLGAPWIDGKALASYLNRDEVPGVRFEPIDFTPGEDPFEGRICHGVRIILEDRRLLDAPAMGVELARALSQLYPRTFQLDRTRGLIGAQWVVQAIRDGEEGPSIAQRWQASLERFLRLRAKYLLY